MTALAEAWLLGLLLAAGLLVGSLAALALGHLLAEPWLHRLRPPLEAAVRALPLLLLLAVPVLLWAGRLYPWASGEASVGWWADTFALRTVATLVLWAAVGRALARPGDRRWTAGATLLLLVPTTALAWEDLALSRDAGWTGSLQGFALLVEQTGAALALAVLIALHRGVADDRTRTGLERTLLTVAMATLWLWFVQFIVVWAADLPREAAWYVRRSGGGWLWLHNAVALPALLGAIALALVPQWRRWRLLAVCALLVAQHAAHLVWIVRPDAPGAASPWADAIVFVLVAAALVVAWRWARPACYGRAGADGGRLG